MNIPFEIKEPFSYWSWPMVILSVVCFSGAVYLLIPLFKKLLAGSDNKEIKIVELKPEKMENIKRKYIGELGKIYRDYSSNKLNVRAAYQKMSICVRKFVYEVTGVKVQNYTLQDIKMLNMPMLEVLISDYYNPEFNKNSTGNFEQSIQNTKRVIEEWK